MRAKKVHGGRSCGHSFWFASKSTATRDLEISSVYKNFPTLKPNQVEAVRGEHTHRSYSYRIQNIKDAFLRANIK